MQHQIRNLMFWKTSKKTNYGYVIFIANYIIVYFNFYTRWFWLFLKEKFIERNFTLIILWKNAYRSIWEMVNADLYYLKIVD
jgi:hypothetical protein